MRKQKLFTEEPIPDRVRNETITVPKGETEYWLLLEDAEVELMAQGVVSERGRTASLRDVGVEARARQKSGSGGRMTRTFCDDCGTQLGNMHWNGSRWDLDIDLCRRCFERRLKKPESVVAVDPHVEDSGPSSTRV